MMLDIFNLHSLHFTEEEFDCFLRMLQDAAQVYALAGNSSGLAFTQAVATALHVAGNSTPREAILSKVIALNIQQSQQAQQRAETN